LLEEKIEALRRRETILKHNISKLKLVSQRADIDIIEISELDMNDNFDSWSAPKSTNFGSGIELLMNDKVKDSHKPTSDIDLDDLNNLENELNDLAGDDVPYSSFKPKSDLFDSEPSNEKPSVRFSDSNTTGQNTAGTASDSKTWDGYGKFNNIPINPDKHVHSQPQMTKEETLREKFKFLRKLEALEKKGVELSKKYNNTKRVNVIGKQLFTP
jgi:hypothetical protein